MHAIQYSTRRVDGLIILMSLLAMLAVISLPFKTKPLGDKIFHRETKSLALYLKGDAGSDKVVVTRAPGPILFYLPAYMMAPSDASDGEIWRYATIFSFVIATISLLLIFRIACRFFSKEVGLLTIFFFLVLPIHNYYSLGILAEIPAFFSLTLALYGWSLVLNAPDRKRGWVLLGFGLCFLVLNRPNTMLLLLLGFAVAGYAYFKDRLFFGRYGKPMILVLVCSLLTVFAVLLGAKKITAQKAKFDQENYFLYIAHQGRFQFREEPGDFRFWGAGSRSGSKDYENWVKSEDSLIRLMQVTRRTDKEVYRDFVMADIKAHPMGFVKQFFVKCFFGNINILNSVKPEAFSLGPLKGVKGYWLFTILINLINLLAWIGMVIFFYKEKRLLRYWLFWGILIALFVFHGLTYMEPRYIFPARSVVYLLGAAGLYQITLVKHLLSRCSPLFFRSQKVTV